MEGPALERVVYLEDSDWGLMPVWKDADFGRGAGLGRDAGLGSGVCLEHAGPGGMLLWEGMLVCGVLV